MHNHSAIAITSSGVGSRRKNMSSMVLGQAPVARALPLARGAREGGQLVGDRSDFRTYLASLARLQTHTEALPVGGVLVF